MAKKLDDIIATLAPQRRARIEDRAMKLATPKALRKVVEASRKDLSAVFDVVPNVRVQQTHIASLTIVALALPDA